MKKSLCQPGRISKLLVFAAFALLASSCVESLKAHNSILTRLRNRGPVALSPENPYLAANLLLSKEMETSPELKGFIEHRGVPSAIEVQHELFEPLLMTLYYPAERQLYTLEENETTWFIRGPTPMDSELMKKVQAVAAFQGGRTRLPELPQTAAKATAIPTIEVLASPIPTPEIGFQSPAATKGLPRSDSDIVSELAKGHEKELAEISPKGDIVHYVTYPNENLAAITRWYTFDVANEGRVARINRIKEGASLSLGDTIIIPSYLIRNKLRLTEQAAQELR